MAILGEVRGEAVSLRIKETPIGEVWSSSETVLPIRPDRSQFWIRLAKIVGAALLLTLAFPPFDLGPFVLIALVPLLSALAGASPKRAWGSGYLFGLVFSLGQLHWLAQLTQKWTGSVGLALVPWLLASFAMACYFGLFGLLASKSFERKCYWWIPLVWAGIEVFRTYVPILAFPWALLATPLWRFPALIQLASIGTIYLVSAWVVGVNLGVYMIIRERRLTRASSTILGAAAGLAVISIAVYMWPRQIRTVSVTLGQVGVDMAFSKPDVIAAEIPPLVQAFQASAAKDRSQILILSEGIAAAASDGRYFSFSLDSKMPILFGAQREVGPHTVYQSAIGYDGNWRHADKTRLVIFGEFVPGRDFIPFLQAFGLPGGDLSAGPGGVQAMDLHGLTVGPLLCFEGLFPDLGYRQALNGSELIAIMSNDDWFMDSAAPQQLRSAAIWRAVETGLPVVRVGSLGYSIACDGKGRLLSSLPLGKRMAKTVPIPAGNASTIARVLPVFPVLSALAAVLVLLTRRSRKGAKLEKERAPQPPSSL